MSGSCAVRGRRFAQPCRKNWPIPPGPSCSSEPHSSPPGPAALEPSVYDRAGAAISDRGLSKRPGRGASDVMRYTTFLAISAAIVALVVSACDGSSRSSTSATAPALSAAGANPVQRENSRPGTPGWEIPASAGTVITGYASETSVAPGQSFHLHVAAPPGSRYRVLVYRLGWYRGVGGRLVKCVPGCRSSQAAIAQPPPTAPGSATGLFRAPWRVTDRVEIPPDAVSGYYEAKLEIVGGAHAGAVGSVPLIVRQSPSAPASAVLVQVPVNTWEAYNPWGGMSLYQFGTSHHAVEVSFDRPFDQKVFHNMGTELELPWVRFLERNG